MTKTAGNLRVINAPGISFFLFSFIHRLSVARKPQDFIISAKLLQPLLIGFIDFNYYRFHFVVYLSDSSEC